MNFCGGKILNCFYENHRHKKSTRGETRGGREWTAGARSASSPAPRWAARSAAPWARATGRTRRSRIKYVRLCEFARFDVSSLFSLCSHTLTHCVCVFDRLLSLCFFRGYTQIPGMLKVRHIGRTTMGSAGLFSLFLGAGSLLHCGRRS